MDKPLHAMTLDEAEAFRKGYDVGFAAGMKAAEFAKKANHILAASAKSKVDPCITDNPAHRCMMCTCWKMYREYCS